MLDLAQADALAAEGHAPIDLAEIGREVVAAMASKVFAAHRELRFESHGEAQAIGLAEAIFRIYRNLIDNALAHAPGRTPIDVTAVRGARLWRRHRRARPAAHLRALLA